MDISQQVSKLNIPIVFIAAENDALVSTTAIKEFVNKIQKGKHISIKNCGYMIPLEKPKELASLLNMV